MANISDGSTCGRLALARRGSTDRDGEPSCRTGVGRRSREAADAGVLSNRELSLRSGSPSPSVLEPTSAASVLPALVI
jgi:hypothetical protein